MFLYVGGDKQCSRVGHEIAAQPAKICDFLLLIAGPIARFDAQPDTEHGLMPPYLFITIAAGDSGGQSLPDKGLPASGGIRPKKHLDDRWRGSRQNRFRANFQRPSVGA